MAQKVQQVALAASQETQVVIMIQQVQQVALVAPQETQEAITAQEVCSLSSVAVSIGDQNLILSRKLTQTQLKSNSRKIDHHLPIAAANVIQTIDASMQENLTKKNLFYGLIQTMVDMQENGGTLSMSD